MARVVPAALFCFGLEEFLAKILAAAPTFPPWCTGMKMLLSVMGERMKPPTSSLGEYLLAGTSLKAERSQAVCSGVNAPTISGRDVRRENVSLVGFIFFNTTAVISSHTFTVLSDRFSETRKEQIPNISLNLLKKA